MTTDALLIIKKRIEKDPTLKEAYLEEKMNRLEALKIAKIAYKEMNDVVEKWNMGTINWLPVQFHWSGNITVGDHDFIEGELVEYKDEE